MKTLGDRTSDVRTEPWRTRRERDSAIVGLFIALMLTVCVATLGRLAADVHEIRDIMESEGYVLDRSAW